MFVHLLYRHIFAVQLKPMRKLLILLLLAANTYVLQAQPVTWKVDVVHSNVKFTVTHMIVSEMDGTFRKFDGTVVADNADFNNAKINFTVDVNSIFTDDENRDNHLKSDDFFNAAKYPNMTFTSTSFKKTGDKKYLLEGDLTIRNVTKRVKWEVTGGSTAVDPWGNTKAGFKATTVINRLAYDLKWNKAVESGGWVVGEDVTVVLNIELNKSK